MFFTQHMLRSPFLPTLSASGLIVGIGHNSNTPQTIKIHLAETATKKVKDPEDVCAICLEQFDWGVCQLDCNHMYHLKCLQDFRSHGKASNLSDSCPMCFKKYINVTKVVIIETVPTLSPSKCIEELNTMHDQSKITNFFSKTSYESPKTIRKRTRLQKQKWKEMACAKNLFYSLN